MCSAHVTRAEARPALAPGQGHSPHLPGAEAGTPPPAQGREVGAPAAAGELASGEETRVPTKGAHPVRLPEKEGLRLIEPRGHQRQKSQGSGGE